ncbi:transposase, partial [Aquibacillus koreensis]|uniref:transposase n=1 Tax=Aquibacillus koreensis TaxID=279446 RepID=UPI0021A72B0A
LFLQHLYNLSDEKMEVEASLNLAFLYFLGLDPEDTLPDKSLLSKFRKHRLGEDTLDDILTEMVRQCVEGGVLKGKSVSLDATHIMANTIKKTPERLMKHLARMIIHTYEKETIGGQIKELPEVPRYEEIKDHREAKMVMKNYLEKVMELVAEKLTDNEPLTSQWIQKAKDILYDPKFINQKGIRSLIDEDARVGRKSKTQSFYGYKTEIMMTTDQRIITSVRTADGSYMDGGYTKEMLEQTLKSGMKIEEVYGDKAYFRKPILDEIDAVGAKPYIPVSSTVYRIDEAEFTYNKDSDEWQCSEGNMTVKKKQFISKNKDGERRGYRYYFDIKQCKECPLHDLCAKKSARRILTVGKNTAEFYEISQYQKTEEFIEKYK